MDMEKRGDIYTSSVIIFAVIFTVSLGSFALMAQRSQKNNDRNQELARQLEMYPVEPLKPTQIPIPTFIVEKGETQLVFDWSITNCSDDWDVPDSPARAFIDYDGNVQLISASDTNRRNIGDNLGIIVLTPTPGQNQMAHECNPILSSHHNCEPRMYDSYEWLTSPYTLNGIQVYALIHNEYHGDNCSNCNEDRFNCWWNSINLASSTNQGQLYTHLLPPNHNIVNSPVDFDPDNQLGNLGYFEPSNIIQKGDFFYALVNAHNSPDKWGACIMRTSNLADPSSWRLWDGSDFNLPGDKANCTPLNPSPPHYQVSYNTYLNKYISLLCWTEDHMCKYSFSDDLIHWTNPANLIPDQYPGEYCHYGSLLQPGDPTRNFEETGRSPWLYYTICNNASCEDFCPDQDRDLKRTRIRFNKTGDEGKYELLDLRMNEKRGGLTLDSAFYGNDGHLTSASFNQEGESNYLHFGGNGKVEVYDSSSLDVSGQITIEADIRTSQVIGPYTFPVIIRKEDDALRNYALFLTNYNQLDGVSVLHFSLAQNSGGGYNGSLGTVKINDGAWHHIKVTYDNISKTAYYYVDEVLDVARNHGVTLGDGINDNPVTIGDNTFTGDIDNLTILNYVASPAPTNTPTPTVTPSPLATATPGPSATPTPSPTAGPSPTPSVTPTDAPPGYCAQDINTDHYVDLVDVNQLINYSTWNSDCDNCREDVNGDGRVSLPDLSMVINYIEWNGWCGE